MFFVFLIFQVQSCGSLFSLYKPPLWNLIIVSWSVRETKQNGILVCDIWWLFEFSNFLEWWCGVSREREERRKKKLSSSLIDHGPHIFCLLCCLFWHPPFCLLHPLFFLKKNSTLFLKNSLINFWLFYLFILLFFFLFKHTYFCATLLGF